PRLPAGIRQAGAGSGRRADPIGRRSFRRARPTRTDRRSRPASARPDVAESEHVHAPCSRGEHRRIEAASGKVYDFCAHGLRLQCVLSGGGAVVAGMISTGVGEATLPALVRRSRFPVPVAAATSAGIVAGTGGGAAPPPPGGLLAGGAGGARAPRTVVWARGGGGGWWGGTRLEGRVRERASRLFFAALFAAIGLAFLLAFTVYAHRFV